MRWTGIKSRMLLLGDNLLNYPAKKSIIKQLACGEDNLTYYGYVYKQPSKLQNLQEVYT